jgi:galactitol-specific phosphotransferase system IIB component
MNERIKELIKQHGVDITIDSMGYGEGNIEGLAELLILKCAHLVGGYTKENEFGTDVKEAYEEITKHFGVKE